MNMIRPIEESKIEDWSFRSENNVGPMFEAWSASKKQEISCYRFDNSENHPPEVRNKFCLFVESNDNRAQIWVTKETLDQIIAGLQMVSE
jgi:hypothetical protein